MLELDEVLTSFVKQKYSFLTVRQQQQFELLLQESDADLFSWLFSNNLPTNTVLQEIVFLIKNNKLN